MKKHVLFGALLLTAALSAGLTGCSSSGTKESGSPKVEISEIRDDVVEPDFSGADIEVCALKAPIDFDYSIADADMIFKKKDGAWLDAMEPEIPLNQEKFEAMAQNFLNLHAISEVGDAENLSDYGFDEPAYEVTITDSEKGEVTFDIGNKDSDGNYYLSDGKKLYLVKASTVDALVFEYDTLVVRDGLTLQIAPSDLQKVSITMDGKTTEITSADNEALTTIANGINNLKAFDYASYHLAEQDLANTDLTTDTRITFQAELTVNGEKKSLTIYVGTYADPNRTYRYVQLDGSDMIMVVDNTAVLDLLNGMVPEKDLE